MVNVPWQERSTNNSGEFAAAEVYCYNSRACACCEARHSDDVGWWWSNETRLLAGPYCLRLPAPLGDQRTVSCYCLRGCGVAANCRDVLLHWHRLCAGEWRTGERGPRHWWQFNHKSRQWHIEHWHKSYNGGKAIRYPHAGVDPGRRSPRLADSQLTDTRPNRYVRADADRYPDGDTMHLELWRWWRRRWRLQRDSDGDYFSNSSGRWATGDHTYSHECTQ
jgi:hypothetical protein